MAARPESIGAACRSMLGLTAADPSTPELERGRLQLLPHQSNHLRFRESELKLDRLEGRAVLPGHFNDPIQIFARGRYQRRTEQ